MFSKDQCLAEALNELRDANLFREENDAIAFVEDYFVNSAVHDESDSDSEYESSSSDASDTDNTREDEEENVNEEPEGPFVNVDFPPFDDGDTNGVLEVDAQRTKARDFSCKCHLVNGGPCSERFSVDEFVNSQYEISELTRGDTDMFILGLIRSATTNTERTTTTRRKEQKVRERQRSSFIINGLPVCRTTFVFLHNMGIKKLRALQRHYRENGCKPRVHKNTGRTFPNHLAYDDRLRVHNFLGNYAETHAILLPGRIPGFKRDDIKLLPSCETKANVWRKYKLALEESGHRVIALTTFRKLWNIICPFIVCCKPMTDVCWQCQKNNGLLYRSVNLPDAEKQERCRIQQAHLTAVSQERSFYRELVRQAKENAELQGVGHLGPNKTCTRRIEMHYSFDYAQQVHYPADPFQPGPVYFLVPRKLGIFGIHCEGVSQQVNYLVDEAVLISKGSNSVVSYLNHFFETYGLGESSAHLHCDNCSGQNKNRFVLWYMLWRCMCGLHRSLQLHFMVVGHTKFAPDWCFGLFKQRYRRTPVSCLDDVTAVVNASTQTGVNIPQLVGDEAGNIFVPQFDWQEFLTPYFKQLQGIKSFQHFRFTSDEPGVVYCRQKLSEPEKSFQLLKSVDNRPTAELPEARTPPGLDAKRQWYLYDKIRQFCSTTTKDIVCPLPPMPKP